PRGRLRADCRARPLDRIRGALEDEGRALSHRIVHLPGPRRESCDFPPSRARNRAEEVGRWVKKRGGGGHYRVVNAAMVLRQGTPGLPSFRELFETHVRYVYRALIHFGVPERHAEDACQEVFVVVSRKLAECGDPEHLRSWLYAIAWRV